MIATRMTAPMLAPTIAGASWLDSVGSFWSFEWPVTVSVEGSRGKAEGSELSPRPDVLGEEPDFLVVLGKNPVPELTAGNDGSVVDVTVESGAEVASVVEAAAVSCDVVAAESVASTYELWISSTRCASHRLTRSCSWTRLRVFRAAIGTRVYWAASNPFHIGIVASIILVAVRTCSRRCGLALERYERHLDATASMKAAQTSGNGD
jgi:hypothetical protein